MCAPCCRTRRARSACGRWRCRDEHRSTHRVVPAKAGPQAVMRQEITAPSTSWPGLVPAIHVAPRAHVKDVDARAFASLRPRRRDKPGHDGGERGAPQLRPVVMGPGFCQDDGAVGFRFKFQTAHSGNASQRVRAKRGPMTGFAKQSSVACVALLGRTAPRNDSGETHLRSLATDFARVLHRRSPSRKTEGAGKAGWPLHPGPPRKRNLRERDDHRYRR